MSDDTPKFPVRAADNKNKNKEENNNILANIGNAMKSFITATPSNTKSFFGIKEDKSQVNWENRTLKVLTGNRIFGGQLKKKALVDYANELKESSSPDQLDPLTV